MVIRLIRVSNRSIKMPRYKILVEYDGTDYNGWQLQPKGKTVEGAIETGLSQILQQPVDIVGQGRTDSGVHAEGQAAHFDFPKELDGNKMIYALLGVLPRDIAVWNMERVAEDFHARFNAKSRRYRFQAVTRPSPLWERQAEMVLEELDLKAMRSCAEMILGTHDFESFTISSEDQERTECEVTLSEWSRQDHLLFYRIRANRFLRRMVRRLAGTMIRVGQKKNSIEDFQQLLREPSKDRGGHSAAAKGLILERVEY